MKTPLAIWFTGLPGSGKTTLSHLLFSELQKRDIQSVLLDGDEIRKTLNLDLGFTEKDRMENIRRIAEVDKLLLAYNITTINAFIAPTESIRARFRNLIPRENLFEVYLDTPLKICEQRDPKGLYKRARQGALSGFTGIDAPFDDTVKADLVIATGQLTIEESFNKLLYHLDML